MSGNALGDCSQVVNIDTFVLTMPSDFGHTRFLPPPVVSGLTARPGLHETLVNAILTAAPCGLLALDGFPGSGKSSLASLACHDSRVVERFRGRIMWLTVGQSRVGPALAEYIGDICDLLGRRRPATPDPLLAGAALGEVLDDLSDVLLVIDDVWSTDQAEAFLRGGITCLRLFTARSSGLVAGATSVDVAAMTPSESRETLMRNVPPGYDALGIRLVEIADGWPLVLGLLNAALRRVIRSGTAPAEVESWAIRIARHPGSYSVGGAAGSTFALAVETSLRLLPESSRRRCLELGIFRDDTPIPAAAVESLWRVTGGLDPEASKALTFQLIDLRLADPVLSDSSSCLSLHDLMRSYLRDTLGAEGVANTNGALLDSWREELLDGNETTAWWDVEESQAFVIEHLPWHLRAAGRGDEMEVLATDFRWIETQVRGLGSAVPSISTLEVCGAPLCTPLADFLGANLHVLLPDERPVLTSTLVGRAGQHGALTELARRRQDTLGEPAALPVWRLPDLRLGDPVQHYGPIGDCAVSPDGLLLATASDDGLVVVWEAGTLRPERALHGHRYRARACSFSPSGVHIASTGMDGTARLWRVATGVQERVLGDRRGRMLGVAWSRDGRWVATVDTLGRVTVWEASSGATVMQVEVPGVVQWSCVFGSGDSEIIACGEDGVVRVWGVVDGTLRDELQVHDSRLRCVTVTRDGRLLAVVGNDGFVGLVEPAAGEHDAPSRVRELAGHAHRVRWCAFSPDGSLLASAGEDRTVRIWDVSTGVGRHVLTGHTDWVGGCVFDPSGSLLYSCGGDASVRTWDTETGANVAVAAGPVVATESCAALRNGEVLIGRADGAVERLRAADGQSVAYWHAHEGRVFGVAETSEGLVTGGADGRMRGWTVEGQATLDVPAEADSRVMQVASTSSRVGFVAEGGELAIVRVDSSEERRVVGAHRGNILGCAFAADGRMFASAGDDGSIALWDGADLQPLRRLNAEQDVAFWATDFASDDSVIVASGEPNGVVYVWDLVTGSGTSFVAGSGRVSGCAIDSSSTWLATCGEDGLLAVWDLQSHACVTGVRVAAPLRRVVWARGIDGPALVAAGAAGTYRFELSMLSADDSESVNESCARR